MTASGALNFELRLEIERACERLCQDYAYYADRGESDLWAGLFSEDAEMHLFGQVHSGRAAIRGMSGGKDPDRVTVHSLSNIRIEVIDPNSALGSNHVMLFVQTRSAPSAANLVPVLVGTYEDEFRRTPEGWRIWKRTFIPRISSPGP
jgi:hypothetical protein